MSKLPSIFVAIDEDDSEPICYGDTLEECVDKVNEWNGKEPFYTWTYSNEDFPHGVGGYCAECTLKYKHKNNNGEEMVQEYHVWRIFK